MKHKALATVEEFKAASQLSLNARIAWWNERVKASKSYKPKRKKK